MMKKLKQKHHFKIFAVMVMVIIILIVSISSYPIYADDEIIDEEFIIPDGGGEVIEYVEDIVTRREFYTIKTESGNVFYIIIDNEKSGGNVYFLNDVDESDLIEFVKDKSETTSVREVAVPVPEVSPPIETAIPVEEASSTIDTKKETNKAPLLMGLVFLAVAGGGAYWYFKIRKPKPISGIISSDDDEYDEYDELYSETVINEDNDDEEE